MPPDFLTTEHKQNTIFGKIDSKKNSNKLHTKFDNNKIIGAWSLTSK